ncbi:FHIPEP family type III secretion protein [uncultured Parasphingorhabdus sp.]|uniref:FHIPEP family type III secretion protein n=1 Tax=uncultured Parasphingorhabdus sp. TaxID=2709694 RepID=UPI002AA9075C|nr:FHIPEP family type III secretion protein [uncultured Parasphingorhabdus sp.]
MASFANISVLTGKLACARAVFLPAATISLLIVILAPTQLHVAIVSAIAFALGFTGHQFRAVSTAESRFEQQEAKHAAPISEGADLEKPGLAVKIGYGLFPLVEDRKGAPLMSRLAETRNQICREFGFAVSHIPVKVDLSLEPNSYRISIGGLVLGEGVAWPDEILAVDDGDVETPIAGRACKDPTFGMDAVWIAARQRTLALAKGYLVVDAPTAIATHLHDIAQRHAAKLFGADDVQQLLDFVGQSSPKLADKLAGELLSRDKITTICRALLAENIPVKDFGRISLAMVRACESHSDAAHIAEAVRAEIGDLIVGNLVPACLPLPVMTMDASLDAMVVKALKAGQGESYPLDPRLARQIIDGVHVAIDALPRGVRHIALICSPTVRKPLSALLRPRFPDLAILSDAELPERKTVEVFAKIGVPPSSRTMAATSANQF